MRAIISIKLVLSLAILGVATTLVASPFIFTSSAKRAAPARTSQSANRVGREDREAAPTPTPTPTPVVLPALYGASRDGELFTINLATGAGSFVGILPSSASTEIEFDNISRRAFTQFPSGAFAGQEFDIATAGGIGSPIPNGGAYTGLEWVGSTLYGTVTTPPNGPSQLRILDPFTGASSLIGPTGVGPISGLAFDATSSIMYGAIGPGAGGNSDLVTVNLATGAATLIGSVGFRAGSIEFGPDGSLYGGDADSGDLYRINPITGASTLVGPTGFLSVTGLAMVTAAGPTPTPTPTPTPCTPGPDYLVTSSNGASIVPGTTQVPGSVCNVCTVTIPLPFNYSLYGTSYSQVVGSNSGTLQFTGNTSNNSNTCLPAASHTDTIFAYWDNLNTNISDIMGIWTSVSGTAPNRVFNIEWRSGYVAADAVANFEVRLYEGQPKYEVIYANVTRHGFSATVGVQQGNGAVHRTQYACNTQNTIQNGQKLTFDLRACLGGAPVKLVISDEQ